MDKKERCPKGTKRYAPVGPDCYTQAYINEWQQARKNKAVTKKNISLSKVSPPKVSPKVISPPKVSPKVSSLPKQNEKCKKGTKKFAPLGPKCYTQTEINEFKQKKTQKIESKNSSKEKKTKKAMTTQKISDKKARDLLAKYAKDGYDTLSQYTEAQLSAMILVANDAYHTNGESLISDSQYDLLRQYVQETYPDNTAVLQVGAPIKAKDKVRLPYNMPSMDKIKPGSNALALWTQKYGGPYVLSCKLDGVSGMYSTEGPVPKLYTRGDGSVGQDISHLIKALRLPNHTAMVVRGEFIITKKTFKEKYANKFANARNLVAGFVNSKTLDKTVHDVRFVCYEVIKPELKPSEQMEALAKAGHEVVQNETVETLSTDLLSQTLMSWRAKSEYEMDGIIVANDAIYPRTAKNPEHAFAFKMALEDQTVITTVVDVIWKASQDGYLKPRIQVTPVNVGGVTIEYATGFNGKFIEENKIGPGAEVQLIRSGDVIPYIQSVLKAAPNGAAMPKDNYIWNATHVDILVADMETNETVKEKNVVGFFTDLGVDGLSTGNVRRIMASGYDTVPAIIHMSVSDFLKVDGFKEKMAEKVHASLHAKLEKASLVELMAASNKFGRGMGVRVITPLIEAHPDFLVSGETREVKLAQLNSAGIHKNAPAFLDAVEPFTQFMKECGLEAKLSGFVAKSQPQEAIKHVLNNKSVVMSGIRDKEIAEFLKTVGATLEDGIKPNTVVLIVKDTNKETNKTKDAHKKNIPIMSVAEFREKYM